MEDRVVTDRAATAVNTASAPDGSLRHTWGGSVGAANREWLAARLPEVETPVVVMHHNVATLPENPSGKWSNFPLDDADLARDLLADHGVELVVTEHHHVPEIVDHGPVTELLCPAVCSFPQAMVTLTIGPAGTIVRLVPLATSEEVPEAHRLAATGKPVGAGILELVEARLCTLPRVDQR